MDPQDSVYARPGLPASPVNRACGSAIQGFGDYRFTRCPRHRLRP